jgi:predicted nucleic acid-binding protein
VTHNYVVVEATALVHKRLGPAALRDLLDSVIPLLTTLWIERDVHSAAVGAHLAAARRRVSLVDWVSFEVMRREGIERALAFDRDFAAQGFETVP